MKPMLNSPTANCSRSTETLGEVEEATKSGVNDSS